MTSNEKGDRRERELVNLLDETGFAVLRAPASGSATTRELPDVLAGDGGVFYAIEAKSSSGDPIYIDEAEVEALEFFADNFGAGPLVAARFDYEDWAFFTPGELYRTPKDNYRVKQETAVEDGRRLDDLGGEPWPVGLGAVLYNARHDRPEDRRDLWHVTSRYLDVDAGARLYELWDGTHTGRKYYHAEDILADFEPAGWQWPTGEKPLYHLTRQCGVDDPDDLMTDGGVEMAAESGNLLGLPECPQCARPVQQTTKINPTTAVAEPCGHYVAADVFEPDLDDLDADAGGGST